MAHSHDFLANQLAINLLSDRTKKHISIFGHTCSKLASAASHASKHMYSILQNPALRP